MATFLLAKRVGDCIYQILMAAFSLAERDCDFVEDRISGLPDDLILTILSSMGMKEAAKSSILSNKWRYRWAKRTHLDFDHFLVLQESDPDIGMCCFTVAQKDKYINWVNQVVGLHCDQCIDTFRVCFLCDSNQFDKWVRFALFRKVKNLELYSPFDEVVYTLGFDILTPSLGIADSGITSLTSLHLHGIDVTGDFIEFLLSKCHHLEHLYVAFSSLLVKLKVTGLSCKLKRLAVHRCSKLEELEIDAVNLTYFDYMGRNTKTNLVLKTMAMLVEVAFGGSWVEHSPSIFQKISHLAAQIYKLSVEMKLFWFRAGPLPTFCNLKHLSMVVECNLVEPARITPLLEACPVLHELKLEIYWRRYDFDWEASLPKTSIGRDFDLYLDLLRLRPPEGKTHPSLKLLQIVAYSGCSPDVYITLYIVCFACNLETIICDPNPNRSNAFLSSYSVERSRARAYKLEKIIPPKISVIII